MDLGLPSGTKWARANLNVGTESGLTWTDISYQASYVSWANTDGHNPDENGSFDPWSFGSASDGEPYVSSPGHDVVYPYAIPASHDIARLAMGSPWYIPSSAQFNELMANCDYIDAEGNVIPSSASTRIISLPSEYGEGNINGILLRSRINGERIFFPACGEGVEGSVVEKGTNGRYWSGTPASNDFKYALQYNAAGNATVGGSRPFHGLCIRPVF